MSGYNTINVNEKVREARMGLIKTEPFYACLLLGLELVEAPKGDTKCPTFNINSKRIMYNPDFVRGLSMKTIKVVLHHEVLHLVFQHHLRAGKIANYNHKNMNIAGDLAIDSHLFLEDGFPSDGLVPGRGDYADFPIGLSAEEYYKILSKKDEENKQPEASDDSEQETGEENDSKSGDSDKENGSDEENEGSEGENSDSSEEGESEDASGSSDEGDASENGKEATPSTFGDFEASEDDAESVKEEEEIKDMVARAIAATKMAGSELPSLVETNLDKIMGKPSIPWEKILRNALSVRKRAGVNWKKPSRRASGGFIMPSRQVKCPGGILFVADASYSMDVEEIKAGLVECQGVLELSGEIDYWEFSTKVTVQKTFTREDSFEDHKLGPRGGTRFQCVVDKLIEERKRPEIIVVCTDLELEKLDWSKELKGSTVIWLSTGDKVAESGKTINIRK